MVALIARRPGTPGTPGAPGAPGRLLILGAVDHTRTFLDFILPGDDFLVLQT